MEALSDFSLRGCAVLVIEDDPASRLFLSRLITKFGGNVQTAESGEAGFRMFEQARFPLVVTDICMPGMDGIELVKRIRRIDPSAQIIATSANSEGDGPSLSGNPGFNDYLIKPVEIDRLLEALKRCCDRIAAGEPPSRES